MIVPPAEFLGSHHATRIAQRAREFAVVNIHRIDIAAPAARIFPELAAPELFLPGRRWKALFGVRMFIGKIFGWDRDLAWHRKQAVEPGKHYGFFRIEHVDSPRELGMAFENSLTHAVMSWLLVEAAGSDPSTVVFNVTCANFYGWLGRAYWRAIRPFHDGLIENSLRFLRRRAEQQRPPA